MLEMIQEFDGREIRYLYPIKSYFSDISIHVDLAEDEDICARTIFENKKIISTEMVKGENNG